MLELKWYCIEFGTDRVSVVLMEEERLQLNVEEVVPDPGQEARSRVAQLGVCETSANNRHVLIRFNPYSSKHNGKQDGWTVEELQQTFRAAGLTPGRLWRGIWVENLRRESGWPHSCLCTGEEEGGRGDDGLLRLGSSPSHSWSKRVSFSHSSSHLLTTNKKLN